VFSDSRALVFFRLEYFDLGHCRLSSRCALCSTKYRCASGVPKLGCPYIQCVEPDQDFICRSLLLSGNGKKAEFGAGVQSVTLATIGADYGKDGANIFVVLCGYPCRNAGMGVQPLESGRSAHHAG
jgi:hypothetical protein